MVFESSPVCLLWIVILAVCFVVLASYIYFVSRDLQTGDKDIRREFVKRVKRYLPTTVNSRFARTEIPQGRSQVSSVDCNEIVASPLAVPDVTGQLRQVCRCHWPTLYGQNTAYSDCDVQHACDSGKGVLVHKVTRRPLMSEKAPVDIHDYECSSCDRCNVPGEDPHTGLPSCLPRPFNDRERDMCVYGVESDSEVYTDTADTDDASDRRTTSSMLAVGSAFVDPKFYSSFTDRVRNTAWVPNPCSYDTITGSRLYGDCELRLTRKSNVAYCAPLRDNAMTAVKEDSYLVNNGGKYPNACFRFTSNEDQVAGYVIEYFLLERKTEHLPSPVVSMRIAKKNVLTSVIDELGLTRVEDSKTLLFTQPEPPPDASEFPHPFNERRMSDFNTELNYWVDELPAKCDSHLYSFVKYNCTAPVQPLVILECSHVGSHDRSPKNKSALPSNGLIGDQTDIYSKTTVACRKPDYDPRFPIVPNYKVKPGAIDADPTSAILYFDKTNYTVYPHWKDAGENVTRELDAIRRYVQEELRSLPNESMS